MGTVDTQSWKSIQDGHNGNTILSEFNQRELLI